MCFFQFFDLFRYNDYLTVCYPFHIQHLFKKNHRHLLGLLCFCKQNAIPLLNFEKLRLGSDQRLYSVPCQKDIR